jgi:DNA-binding LacI/PurR family transcriptional regulator
MKKKDKITSIEVAQLAGVSQSTVSRSFSPESPVAVKTRERILGIANKIGYQPNAMARSLITQKSNIVGIVISNVTTNPFYPEVLDLLSRKFQQNGQKVMLFSVHRDQNLDDILPQLLEYQVDGILITAATLSSAMAFECQRWGTPLTLFNRYIPDSNASWFCCDNVAGGRLVGQMFIDSGHKSPAFLAGNEDTSTSIDREKGFMEIMVENGVKALKEVGNYNYNDAYAAAVRLVDRPDPVDAIFCANDIMAIGALDAIRSAMNMKVPEDVSIIGFDDIPMASWPSFNLTTVRQPVQSMVDDSVEDLISRINTPEKPPNHKVIMGELVIRGSSRISI